MARINVSKDPSGRIIVYFTPWELRIGALRVYYDLEDSPERIVFIRAIGIKERNNVRIGKEVIKL